MKIMIVDNYYPEFLKKVDREITKSGITEYDSIRKKIDSYKFGTADYYTSNLKKVGFEVEGVITNSKLLQRAWTLKHNLFLNVMNIVLEKTPIINKIFDRAGNPLVLIAQISDFKPDIVFIHCIGALPPILTKIIKSRCKYLVGQIASSLPPEKYFKNYDLVVSSLPNMVEAIRGMGVKSEYFPIGFESTLLNNLKNNTSTAYDVTHIGGYGPIHEERNKILEKAAKKINIDFWGYGIKNLSKNSPILKNYHGEAWGLDMYKILNRCKITITSHITKVAGKYANNMTLFEATGCGTLLITDHKSNLHELFEIDKEVVTYKTPKELVKKIKYYLSHEKERKKIALAGQKRTLRDHSYLKRMKQLKVILNRLDNNVNKKT